MDLWLIGCIFFVSLPMFAYGMILATKKIRLKSVKTNENKSNNKSWMTSGKSEEGECQDFTQFAFMVDKICLCASIALFIGFTAIYCIVYV
jgi:hypothetical protein